MKDVEKISSQAVARCRESFSSLVFSQTLLSQTQPWGNATDTQFYKVSHYYSFSFQNPSFNIYNIQTIAIRFAMVRKITVMTKISKGLLDQVTQGNRIDYFFYLKHLEVTSSRRYLQNMSLQRWSITQDWGPYLLGMSTSQVAWNISKNFIYRFKSWQN